MKLSTKIRTPITVNEDCWFYIGKQMLFIHWATERDGRRTCHRINVPAKSMRVALGILDAWTLRRKRRRKP